MRRLICLLIFLVPISFTFHGCGDSSPTGASTTGTSTTLPVQGTTFTVVSGETDQPVVGARFIIVGGEELVTDDKGQVTLNKDAPFSAPVDIVAEGFLVRQTVLKLNRVFSLWPSKSENVPGFHEQFTRVLAYTPSSYHHRQGPPTDDLLLPLWRPQPGEILVFPGPLIQRVPVYMEALRDTVDRMTAATEGQILYRVVLERPASGRVQPIEIESSRDAVPGCNGNGLAGGGALGGIVMCYHVYHPDLSSSVLNRPRGNPYYYFARTSLHEIGHNFGLKHYHIVEGPRGVMGGGPGETVVDFSARERLLIRLMLQRPLANQFPDLDPSRQ